MRIVQIEIVGLKDAKRGVRKGQIGSVVQVLENGALLVDIPNVGFVALFSDQVKDVKDA
jgi:hypothetical protein